MNGGVHGWVVVTVIEAGVGVGVGAVRRRCVGWVGGVNGGGAWDGV